MESVTRRYRYPLLPAASQRTAIEAAAPFIRIMKSAFKESGQGTPGKEQK
jgi:hypothetical protein